MKFCKDIANALNGLLDRYEPEQVCVVADAKAGAGIGDLVIEVSEEGKALETVQRVWDFLFERGITRRGVVVAIGGGILTDLAGFAAATYKRGVDYINVPTTLLAMVDASIGGKTAINYHGIKNSIGLFAPPVETLIWTGWLKSLPTKELLSGFGEMLKTGLVSENRQEGGERLWDALLHYDLEQMDMDALAPLIQATAESKERIVSADPHEEGLRKVLNFGHTFGHVLKGMPHGYAVVYGMIAELYLSVVRLGCSKEPLQQLTGYMLQYYGRPECKCSDRERLIELMRQDKKNERAKEINCTLLRGVGNPVINQVITPAEAAEALEYLFSL